MKFYATTTSERASKGQGGNEYIIVDLNVGRVPVGQIELHYNADSENDWVLQYRLVDSDGEYLDWEILTQGNVIPEQSKGKNQKDECTATTWSRTCIGCKFCKRTLEQD